MIFSGFLWIVLYECASVLGEIIASRFNIFIKVPLLLVYDLLLIIYIYQKGLTRELGLCRTKKLNKKSIILLLPFLVFPIYNIKTFELSLFNWNTVLLMLAVCIAEEIFFRGFLQNLLLKKSKKYGILFSAVIFAFCHALNLFENRDVGYIVMQIISAFSAGVAYGAMTIKNKSLLPAMVLHFLTNITAVTAKPQTTGLSLCVMIYLVYTAIYLKKVHLTED